MTAADEVTRWSVALTVTCLVWLVILIGLGIGAEACDVTEGWVCGVSDDGYHDGTFDWRHGVIPW